MQKTSYYLARGFALRWQGDKEPASGHCALCGQEIVSGVPVRRLIKSSTADIATTFRFGEHVCEHCAACFAAANVLTSNLFASDMWSGRPMVALTSATEDRPAWRDLVRQLPRNIPCVAVVTSNTKRRLWPAAPVSTFGERWRPLFVDGDTERVLSVDVERLKQCLDLVEHALSLGFAKRAIGSSLPYYAKNPRLALRLEAELKAWRGTDEFTLALFISQNVSKKEEGQHVPRHT